MIDTNPVELTWTSVALAGFLIQTVLLWKAVGNLRVVYRFGSPLNGRLLIAWNHVGVAGCLLFGHTCAGVLGVRALLAADPPMAVRWTSDYLIPVGMLLGVTVSMLCAGVWEGYVRRRLNR